MTQITLYQLVGDGERREGRQLSPHVWKSKLDLAYLGQSYSHEGKTFPQIRGELAEFTKNPAVTVPTIIDEDGLVVTDSWKIAEHLEARYGGTPDKSIFGGQAGKEFSKFIEIWSNTALASELRPLNAPFVFNLLDLPSQDYFLKSKFGNDKARFDAHCAKYSEPEVLSAQLAAARNRLTVIEALLGYKKEKGEPLWLSGKPSHADFCLFGWYAASSIHPDVENGVWRHEDNPLVEEWLELILESGLVDKTQLV